MKIIIDEDIKRVDKILFGVFKFLNLIRHVNPVNVSSEKKAFFNNERRNPMFRYKDARRDIVDLRRTLNALDIPKHDFGKIYETIREQLLKQCDIIEAVGVDDSVVKNLTSEIYGWPSEWLVSYSKQILQDVDDADVVYDVPSEVIMGSVQKMFDDIGLSDWKVRTTKKRLTTARHTKKVCVCDSRLFSQLDVFRLAVHEVGVHAVRYANGYTQPLHIFVFGFPDFLKTEEGLATYFEVITGNMNPVYFRNYAGRVIAIDCLKRNLDFRDCYDVLRSHGFSEDDSWNLAVRAYRGGGFVKDHVYLEGYVMIEDFVKNGGDIKELFVGKVGIEHLQIVDALHKKNLIKHPVYMPPFID